MSRVNILVVEDEEDIRDLIHFNLFKNKYNVLLAEDGEKANSILKSEKIHLALLDIMLPKLSGLEICKIIKEKYPDCLVILVSARGEESDVIKGFEIGADDYIAKPFSPKILLARVNAVLRRSNKSAKMDEDFIETDSLKIDFVRRKVFIEKSEITLTFSEFSILELFIKNRGKVYTRSQIVDLIRGDNHAISDRSVDVQIVGLRKKLEGKGKLIETVRGVGYRFRE